MQDYSSYECKNVRLYSRVKRRGFHLLGYAQKALALSEKKKDLSCVFAILNGCIFYGTSTNMSMSSGSSTSINFTQKNMDIYRPCQ